MNARVIYSRCRPLEASLSNAQRNRPSSRDYGKLINLAESCSKANGGCELTIATKSDVARTGHRRAQP